MMKALPPRLASPSRRMLDRGWELAVADGNEQPGVDADWLQIGAPTTVAQALTDAGQWSIDAPRLRLDAQVWWYRVDFDVAEDGPWLLGLDGLATCAEVWLNHQKLLSSGNMFRRHELEVGSLLRPTGNRLLMRFSALDAELAVKRPRPRWRVPMVEHQQLRWFRTTLLGRTPGWSPSAPAVGPWKDVWLERGSALQVTVPRWDARLDVCDGVLEVAVRIDGPRPLDVRLELTHAGLVHTAILGRGPDGAHSGLLRIPDVNLWWPHTHGQPALYQARLAIGFEADVQTVMAMPSVGFRTVEVDQAEGGLTVRVNGEPVFCRGACWTPLDTLRLHTSSARYREVIERVCAAGMNMLRVGGTMVYEHEHFLEACDVAGVLVWQDLMFASMDYPADNAAFLEDVSHEAAEQAARWALHPCVAVVCGNSEVEQQAAMWGADRALWSPPLFHEVLREVVSSVLPRTPWWPSSAHGGDFPFQPTAGTCSYYGVGAYQRDIDDARTSGVRFATESLAFANIPSDHTLRRIPSALPSLQPGHPGWKARVPRDLGVGWDFDDVRDHYVEGLFGERAEAVRRADPARYLALGRTATGEAMAGAFARWRATGSRCSGALVWFLRDLWPAVGWGLLDDEGQPKPAFRALARVLQPLHVSLIDDGLNGLSIHVVNEGPQWVKADLAFALYRDGEFPACQWRRALELAPRSQCRLAATDGLQGFADANWAYRFGVPAGDVAAASLLAPGADVHGPALAQSMLRLGPVQPMRIGDIGLRAVARAVEAGRVELTVSSRATAWSVHLDLPGWQPDDDFFDLPPGSVRVIGLHPTAGGKRLWRGSVEALNSHPVNVPAPPA